MPIQVFHSPLALLLAATAALAQQADSELPANPGFEQLDDDGWAVGWERWPKVSPEPGAISLDANVPFSGARSVRLHHDNPGSYTRVQQVIPVTAGQRYYFRVWMKGEAVTRSKDGGGMGCRMYVEGIGGRDHATGTNTEGTFGWTEMTIGPFEARQGDRVTLMCYLHQSTGTVWYDDVQVIPATADFEKRLLQQRLERRLRADLQLARSAAEAAGDAGALDELQRLQSSISTEALPDRVDYRGGPPHFPHHAEMFQTMARLNARRLPGKAVALWTGDPFEPLPVTGLAPDQGGPQVSVLLGRDERDQGTLNLCNLGAEPLQMKVSLAGEQGAGAPTVTLREAVHVESGGEHLLADPLPRLQDGALTLPPGVFRQLWLDVSSAGARPGIHQMTLALSGPGGPPAQVPVSIEVLPIRLPDPPPIATWNYSYQNDPLIQGRWEQARADLAAHHINAYCWPSWHLPWPKFDDAGSLLPLDWTAFDKALASHDNARFLLLWPQFEFGNLNLRLDLEVGSALWEERFIAWFRALIAGLKERGLGYDRVIWYPTDEPTTATRVGQQVLAARTIHKADPQALVLANPYRACPTTLREKLGEVTDVWCPELSWALDGLMPYFRRTSKHLWTYQVLGFGASAFDGYRLSFWRCWREGIAGHGFWSYSDCGGSNWDRTDEPRNDYAVIYDGDPDELIPGKRWEAWREGVEDYAYLWALRQAGGDVPQLQRDVDALFAQPSPDALAALRARVLRQLAQVAPDTS